MLAVAALATSVAAWVVAGFPAAAAADTLLDFEVQGDAVPAALGGLVGEAARGRAIVIDRRQGNCMICHHLPIAGQPFQGEIGPALDAVGARLDAGQIRLRLIDQSRLNPDTLMPPYYRVSDLHHVAPEYRGDPALTAQQIEDVVAYLGTLMGTP